MMVAKGDAKVGLDSQQGGSVAMLLEEYQGVFLTDLPFGLPAAQGIEHQIDLIPGAPLPNKVAYRCNPKEVKELQCQIEQLMEMG